MEERHVSLSEAADALDISERTAYRWIKSGKLRAYKPGRDYRIPQSAIREVVEASEVRPKGRRRSPLEPTFNGLLEEERRLDLLRALRDDLQAAALGMRRWLELETYTSFAGFEAAPETAPRTVLSLWTGLSNALQDDALARSYIWREVLGAEAAAARSAEEKQLVSEAQKFLEEYRAATRSLREKLDSEWQELLQQEADAQELSEFLKRQREQQPTAQRRAAEVKRLAAGE